MEEVAEIAIVVPRTHITSSVRGISRVRGMTRDCRSVGGLAVQLVAHLHIRASSRARTL